MSDIGYRIVNTSRPDLSSYTLYSEDDGGRREIGRVEAGSADDTWRWHTVFGTYGVNSDRSGAIIDCSRSCENSRGEDRRCA